jgi:apolipoprotein N-acyltransferase
LGEPVATPGPLGQKSADYPVLFPKAARPDRGALFNARGDSPARPGWLLNLTNDAWYGMSPGPYQHFAAARLRAVEEGLPLVRVANNGISAIVDSVGRVRAALALGREGVVDGPLPVALAPTLFSFFGTWSTPFAFVTIALALALARFGRRNKATINRTI